MNFTTKWEVAKIPFVSNNVILALVHWVQREWLVPTYCLGIGNLYMLGMCEWYGCACNYECYCEVQGNMSQGVGSRLHTGCTSWLQAWTYVEETFSQFGEPGQTYNACDKQSAECKPIAYQWYQPINYSPPDLVPHLTLLPGTGRSFWSGPDFLHPFHP